MNNNRPISIIAIITIFILTGVLASARSVFAQQTYTFTPIAQIGSNFGYVGEAVNSSGEAVVKMLDYNYAEHLYVFSPSAPNSPTGTVTDVPPPSGYRYYEGKDEVALNDSGQAVFLAQDSTNTVYILVWNPLGSSAPLAIPIPTGDSSVGGEASGIEINNAGQVVSTDSSNVYVWTPSTNLLPTTYSLTTLTAPMYSSAIVSTAINNFGEVIAQVGAGSDGNMVTYGWTPSVPNGPLTAVPTVIDFGLTSSDYYLASYPGAATLNDAGVIALQDIDVNNTNRFYLWTPNGLDLTSGGISANLGVPGGYSLFSGFSNLGAAFTYGPTAINNAQGEATILADSFGSPHPFTYAYGYAPEALDQFGVDSGQNFASCSIGINNAGQIVSAGGLYSPPLNSYVVTNTNDSGVGSLRSAMQYAGSSPGATITFASGVSGTILLQSPLPVLTATTTIVGPGSQTLAIDGNQNRFRAFIITEGQATISGLTLQNGSDAVDGNGGGAICTLDSGELLLSNCVITGNTATLGGGLQNGTQATAIDCTFTNNGSTSGGVGGGAINNDGILTLSGSTLSDNTAGSGGSGGGLENYNTALLTNCTLYGNTDTGGGLGGAIANFDNVALTNCTLSGNSATNGSDAGALFNTAGAVIVNSILWSDTPEEIVSYNQLNLTYSDVQSGYSGGNSTDMDSDPLLGPLAANGGPTQTMALGPGSPCLGAGSAVSAPPTDQRGVARPNPPSMGAYDTPTAVDQTTHFSVTYTAAPPPAVEYAGVPFDITVTALDKHNNVVTSYAGTVRFHSTLPATLPQTSRLTNGVGTFSVTLLNVGKNEVIEARDIVVLDIRGSLTVAKVVPPPPTVTLTNPVNGDAFAATATVPLRAMAAASTGSTIKTVTFYLNGTSVGNGAPSAVPGLYIRNIKPGGSFTSYNIWAVATDKYGSTDTSNTATITVGVAAIPSSQFLTTYGPYVFNHQTPFTYTSYVTLQNVGTAIVASPLDLVFSSLPAGVTLTNATGKMGSGPYVTVQSTLMPGGLQPGQTITVPLFFSDPNKTAITYTLLFYNGVF